MLGNAVAGAVGAAVSNVIVYPLSVVVARLQTQKRKAEKDSEDDEEEYATLFDALRKIYDQQGIAGLYPGLAQDTCKTVTDSFLFFLAYTTIRQRRIVARVGPARAARSKNIMLPVLDELVIGILAGSFSKLFTTPLSNIVTRKQTSAARKEAKSGKALSTGDIASQIRKEKGLQGFWSGYSAALILTLNPSITFFLNEVLKYTLLPRSKRNHASALVTFLLAAMSKVAASSITYPFSLAKTRAQSMGTSSQTQKSSTPKQLHERLCAALTPQILSTIFTIARTEGLPALYAGLPGEALKGFFSHGFTMIAKDAVYASIIKSYYILLIVLRRYPSSEELLDRAREQAEEYTEIMREEAKDLAERAKDGAEDALNMHSGAVTVDMTSDSSAAAAAAEAAKSQGASGGVDASSGLKVSSMPDGAVNATAELVGDYVEDEASEWKSFYHWFWDKDRKLGKP